MTPPIRPPAPPRSLPAARLRASQPAARLRASGPLLGVAALLVLLAAGPFALFTTGYALDVALRGLYMAMLAGTWSFLSGVAGQFSFAHAAIGGLGGYAGAVWSAQLGDAGWVSGWAPSIAVGTVVGTAVGVLLGLLLRRLAGAYLALFTIACAEVARLVVVAESQLTGGRLSLAVRPQFPGSDTVHYYVMLGLLVAVLALVDGLLRTRVGLNLRALREDAAAAAALGVNIHAHKLFALSLAAALAALGGAVYFHTVDRLAPENLDLLLMSQVIAFAVIGGLERPLAAAAAGLLLTLVLESLRAVRLDADGVLVLAFTVAAVPLVAAAVAIRRALSRRGPGPLRAALAAGWLWALGGVAALGWWLHAPPGWRFGGWPSLLAAALLLGWAVAAARRASPAAGSAPAAVAAAACGVLAGGKLATYLWVNVQPGVWRLAVFGALLALTLRFSPNGLFTPLLEAVAGRGRLRALAVRHRDAPRAGGGRAPAAVPEASESAGTAEARP